jgi:hypothetical protein
LLAAALARCRGGAMLQPHSAAARIALDVAHTTDIEPV